MTQEPASRLAWEISACYPTAAFFGAHTESECDIREIVQPAMAGMVDPSDVSFLSVGESHEYLDSVFDGTALPTDASVVFLQDALAQSSSKRREKLNRGRERLRLANKILVFAESQAGSPEAFDDLRDLLATFRDIVDLRPPVSENDHLWDTTGSFGFQRIAATLPRVVTRDSILVLDGVAHRKAPSIYRCPACGEPMKRAETMLRFVHAPLSSAEQSLPGYVCECGKTWPDPEAVREAHRSAFKDMK